jgi:hypothetical protein
VAVIKSESGSWDDGQEVPVTISHDGEYATATALGCEDPSISGIPLSSAVGEVGSQSPVAVTKPESRNLDNDQKVHTGQQLAGFPKHLVSFPVNRLRRYTALSLYFERANLLIENLVTKLERTGSVLDDERFVTIHEVSPSELSKQVMVVRGGKSDGTDLFSDTVSHGGASSMDMVYIPPTIKLEAGYQMIYDMYHTRFQTRWKHLHNLNVPQAEFVYRVGALKDFRLEHLESAVDRAHKIRAGGRLAPKDWSPPKNAKIKGVLDDEVDEDDRLDENSENEEETLLQEDESNYDYKGQAESLSVRS